MLTHLPLRRGLFTVLRRCVRVHYGVLCRIIDGVTVHCGVVSTLCSGIFDGVRVHYGGVLCRIIDGVTVHYGVFSTLCSGIFDGVTISYCVYSVGLLTVLRCQSALCSGIFDGVTVLCRKLQC